MILFGYLCGPGLPCAMLHCSMFPFSCLYIQSFRIFLKRLFEPTTTQRRSRHSADTVSEFHAEATQATASKGLTQCLCVAARARFETTTFRMKGDESTK